MQSSIELNKQKTQVNQVYFFLNDIYNKTRDSFRNFSLNELAKTHKISTNVLSCMKELQILESKRTGHDFEYKWYYVTGPDLQLATKLNELLRIKNKFYNDKSYSLSKPIGSLKKESSPNRIKIGTKIYSKVIPKEPIKVIKEVATTPSEIGAERMLKMVKSELTRTNVLDFNGICEINTIPERIQYAIIKNEYVGYSKGKGYIWIGGDITLDMVRTIISDRHKYEGIMPSAKIINPTSSFSFESSLGMVSVNKDTTNDNSKDVKFLKNISKYYTFLQAIHKETCNEPTKISLQNLVTQHKILSTFFAYLKHANLLLKKGSSSDTKYLWNDDFKLSIDLAKDTYEWCTKKAQFYANEAKMKKMVSPEIINDLKKEVENSIKKESFPNNTSISSWADNRQSEGRMTRENNNIEITTITKDQPKDIKSILAEKFAKIGNYEMAEKLLDEILETK